MVECPKEWRAVAVKDIGDIITGATPPRGDDDNWNGDFPWLSAKDFKGKYIDASLEHISQKGKSYCRILPKDSVLVTCIASIGLNALSRIECATNQQINAVVCHDADPEFFYYAMAYNEKRFKSLAGQTAVPIINKKQFSDFEIPLPPLPEQRRIAAALGDMDKLIENLGKRIAKKRLIKKGAMQELLTGKKRLPGFSGEWKSAKLKDIGKISKGMGVSRADGDTGNIPAVRYGEIYTHHNDYVKEYLSHISPTVAKTARLTSRGDVLFAGSGETVEDIGKAVAILDDGVYAGGDIIIFSPTEKGDPIFWGTLMNMPYVQAQRAKSGNGATIIHLRPESVAEFRVNLPPPAEQAAIARVLSDMDAEIASLERRQAKLKLIKKGMLQDLLTGKVRI